MSDSDQAQLRIAFVDDDARLLDGLRRMLRRKRREWAMEFASDPREFTGRLASERFDVVVSDMRMPELNGVGVLRAVLRHDPGSTRLVLTGQAHARSWLELMGPAQVVLAKPCDAEQLEAAIQQAYLLSHQFDGKAGDEPLASGEPPLWKALMEGLERERPEPELEALALARCAVSDELGRTLLGAPCETSELRTALGAAWLPVLLGAHALAHCRGDDATELAPALRRAARAVALAQFEHASSELVQQSALAAVLHDLVRTPEAADAGDRERELRRVRRTLAGWGLPDVVSEAATQAAQPRDSLLRGRSPLPYVHAALALEDARDGASGLDSSFLEAAEGCAQGSHWPEVEPAWAVARPKRGE